MVTRVSASTGRHAAAIYEQHRSIIWRRGERATNTTCSADFALPPAPPSDMDRVGIGRSIPIHPDDGRADATDEARLREVRERAGCAGHSS
jgi:hypothetical protein